MDSTTDPSRPRPGMLARGIAFWPWLLLAVMIVPAVWHVVHFPADIDDEYPAVVRPTFSRLPPPAYRLAEPGDTIDRIAIYVSSLATVLALTGLAWSQGFRRRWVAALAISLAAFWYAANPSPTFDGWHGLGWGALLNPNAPVMVRLALGLAAFGMGLVIGWGVEFQPGVLWQGFRDSHANGTSLLFVTSGVFLLARVLGVPAIEPIGYWPRWAFVWALVLFASALVRLLPGTRSGRRMTLVWSVGGVAAWFVFVAGGIGLTWLHRPIDRFREVVPGKIFISAMPSARGLEVVQKRHHLKTIINLFPEDTPYRSPRLPDELAFARTHGVHYLGSPADVGSSNDFLDQTLRLAQDPNAWPILVHCHACMDRTPAWVGIYRFVVEGRPLDEILRFIEGHRGYRPKATVTLLYNRVLPKLAPERYHQDPTAEVLRRCARGSVDSFDRQLQTERRGTNSASRARVLSVDETATAGSLPSLTPRR